MAVTFEELADRVEIMERRIASLEQGVRYQPAPPPKASVPPAPLAGPAYPTPGVSKMDEDAEYFLGAKVLPRAGASVLVLGLGYLVSLAISRGILGPWSLFGFACLICLGFVAVGQWQRNAREQFGDLVTGVGSCGLYVTFAGGHAYQHLYGGEVLVGLFLGLSALNLSYSLWRASTSFLAIGVIGGFGAALMPLRDHAFLLTSVLQATLLLVAAGIAARHRWSVALTSVGLTATFAALPLAYGWPASAWYGVGHLYFIALACVVGAFRIRPEDEGGFPATVAGGFVFLSACIAYSAKDGLTGTYHVLAATITLAAIGFLVNRRSDVRNAIAFGAAIAATLLAPLGLGPLPSVFTYSSLALIFAGIGFLRGRTVATLGGLAFAAALVRYSIILGTQAIPLNTEFSFLLLAVAAPVAVGLAFRSREGEAIGLGASVLVLSRLGYVFATTSLGMSQSESITSVLIGMSLLFLLFGLVRDHVALRFAGFISLGATVLKVVVVDLATTDPVVRVMILMVLGLVMVGGGYGYIRQQQAKEKLASSSR